MGSTTPVSEAEGFVPQEEIDASCRVPVLLAFGSASETGVVEPIAIGSYSNLGGGGTKFAFSARSTSVLRAASGFL